MSNNRHCCDCCVCYQLYIFNFLMKRFQVTKICLACWMIFMCGCRHNKTVNQNDDNSLPSQVQNELLNNGWYVPMNIPSGELPKKYGIKSKYGQQDNYFDIENGDGCDIALKIMDISTNQCIRYVYVPENTSVNIQMIPLGKYILKLAYGKKWMEYDNGDGTLNAKFTDNVSYERSTDVFDFGKKNSSNIVNYLLQINVQDSKQHNNFNSIGISEDEFMK